MQNKTDSLIAVEFIQDTKKLFPNFNRCSFDQGFHSPDNQEKLREILDFVALPKKGKLSKDEKEHQNSPQFLEMRKQHPAVESAINALDIHGLDKCLDHKFDGFEKYIALGVLGRNIQKLGAIIQKKELLDLKNQLVA